MLKERAFSIFVICACLLLCSPVTSIVFAQSGPKTPDMKIHIYLDPDTENVGLDDGMLDIGDWPLSKEWIDEWALKPEKITMREYIGMDMYQIDMNNQKWPTGSETSKFYDPEDEQSVKSLEFRKAIAHLTDRDAIVRDVLRNYGYRLDLPILPTQSDYMDMALYGSLGLIYDYNKTRAIEILDAAGFVDADENGIRNNPTTGNDLEPLKFYIQMYDPKRRRTGEMLTAELESVGVPVYSIIAERTTIPPIPRRIIPYECNLYTGGWSLDTIPDQYYDLYSSYTYLGPDTGWSLNYPGFCNHEFDEWALKVKYSATVEEAKEAAVECGKIFLQYCPVIPLWSSKAVKAYKTGWTGVVNNAGCGIDNYYTFLNMYKGDDSVIDYGFKSDIEYLNVVSSEWYWDHKVLDLIYDSLLGTNPFNLASTEHFIAQSYSVNFWNSTYDPEAIVVTFKIRDNVKWHGDNATLTIEDVSFSFKYTYKCGLVNAWHFPLITDMNRTHIVNSTAIEIYFNHKNAWAVQLAGELPIIRKSIWENVDPEYVRCYEPAYGDINGNGVTDLKEDGTGAWIYDDYSFCNWIKLEGYDKYYLTQTFIENRLKIMFHYYAGDINENGVVNILDLAFIVKALGTNSTHYPHGIDWDEYNPDCDLDQNGKVDALDLSVVTTNYDRKMG